MPSPGSSFKCINTHAMVPLMVQPFSRLLFQQPKVIISTAHVNTKASVSFLREKLSSLDTYIVSIDSNIKIFNDYVKTQVHVLTSRGETENYLMINIFKGHRVENYCVFVSYIDEKKDEYDEGGNITWGNPVEKELNKYKEMVQLKICNDPSQEQ